MRTVKPDPTHRNRASTQRPWLAGNNVFLGAGDSGRHLGRRAVNDSTVALATKNPSPAPIKAGRPQLQWKPVRATRHRRGEVESGGGWGGGQGGVARVGQITVVVSSIVIGKDNILGNKTHFDAA